MEAVLGLGVGAIVLIVILIIVGVMLFSGLRTSIFFTVKTQENVIVERFGKFKKVATTGTEHEDAVHRDHDEADLAARPAAGRGHRVEDEGRRLRECAGRRAVRGRRGQRR